MDPVLPIIAPSLVLGAVIAFLFRKRQSEVSSIAKPNPDTKPNHLPSKPAPKKPLSKPHSSDKDQNKRHHPLDLNTLKGHGDAVTGICFSRDGRNLATACADGVVRVFKLDDASSKSFKFLRINLPAGGQPTALAYADDASSIVLASYILFGCSLYMYGEDKLKIYENNQQSKFPLPEIKWELHKVHDKKSIITMFGTSATYGSADGSTIIASCWEDCLMYSPLFLVYNVWEVWEIGYAKDGSAKEVLSVMQLKGHKSAVAWLCFTPNSEQIITASKDGSMRIWHINVRYHLDEDPKTLKVFQIPLHDSSGTTLHYDRMSISPDGKILAATHGSTLQWLCVETGKVLDTAEKAHDSDISCISWAPKTIPTGNEHVLVLATASTDKKVKLWASPSLPSS